MAVEKKIHLFWTGESMPQPYRENIAYLGHVNEGYDVEVHDLADFQETVAAVWPALAAVVPTIRVPAVLSDIARLVYLLRDGGWYLDCDIQPRAALDFWAHTGHDAYLFFNRPPYGAELRSNFMGVRSGHPMLSRALRNIERGIAAGTYNYDALKLTGPVLVMESFTPFVHDDAVHYEEWDDLVITGVDAETRGSWQFQQCAGIVATAECPPVFNPVPQTPIKDEVGGLNVIGRPEAYRYYTTLFDEFPETRDANYVALLTKAATWYVAFHPEIADDVVAAVERYVDPGQHGEFIRRLIDQLRAVHRDEDAARLAANSAYAYPLSAPAPEPHAVSVHASCVDGGNVAHRETYLHDQIASLAAELAAAESARAAAEQELSAVRDEIEARAADVDRLSIQLAEVEEDRNALRASATWRVGKVVMAPLRAARRIAR